MPAAPVWRIAANQYSFSKHCDMLDCRSRALILPKCSRRVSYQSEIALLKRSRKETILGRGQNMHTFDLKVCVAVKLYSNYVVFSIYFDWFAPYLAKPLMFITNALAYANSGG